MKVRGSRQWISPAAQNSWRHPPAKKQNRDCRPRVTKLNIYTKQSNARNKRCMGTGMKGWLYQQYANDTCKSPSRTHRGWTKRLCACPLRTQTVHIQYQTITKTFTRHKGLVLNRVKQINNKLQRFHNNKLGVPSKVENRLEQIENIRRGCMKHPARRGYHPTPSPPWYSESYC